MQETKETLQELVNLLEVSDSLKELTKLALMKCYVDGYTDGYKEADTETTERLK
jgi:hypothetical protein